MKENIYTIPVLDAFKDAGECPFCNMSHSLEIDAVHYMMGPSYMEDDIRMETNKIGFCQEHYKSMYEEQNRLGLALMVHTHIQKINVDLATISKKLSATKNQKKGLFSKSSDTKTEEICKYINKIDDTCYICDKINITFERYMDTFFYLWKNNTEFESVVKNAKGFCIHHFSVLLSTGEQKLSNHEFEKLIDLVVPLQLESLKRIEDEMDWFIKKFDYRFNEEPWKNSKDALPRSLQKLSSVFLEE